jgi:hypothetical protein
VLGVLAWWHWWGSVSLVATTAVVAGTLIGWRLINLTSFDAWAGRYLRAWWLRWTVYAPKLPDWLHACGLGIRQDAAPVIVAVSPLWRGFSGRRPPDASPALGGGRRALGRIVGRGPRAPGARPETGQISTTQHARWPRPGESPAARSANSPPTWCRSTSNVAICSPNPWPARIWRS